MATLQNFRSFSNTEAMASRCRVRTLDGVPMGVKRYASLWPSECCCPYSLDYRLARPRRRGRTSFEADRRFELEAMGQLPGNLLFGS